jgi:hypothetical protein
VPVRDAGVADDELRANHPTVGHAHAHCAPTLHQDLCELRADEDAAAGTLDDARDRRGDPRRATKGTSLLRSSARQ